jgi:hypothetical protein
MKFFNNCCRYGSIVPKTDTMKPAKNTATTGRNTSFLIPSLNPASFDRESNHFSNAISPHPDKALRG